MKVTVTAFLFTEWYVEINQVLETVNSGLEKRLNIEIVKSLNS